MRTIQSLLLMFAVLCLSFLHAAADTSSTASRPIDLPSLSTSTSASISPSHSATQSGDNTQNGASSKPTSVLTNSSASTSISASTTSPVAPSSVTAAATPSVSVFNATLTPDDLPIPPEITPGFGIAGVFLIVSGTVYTLIGIKNKGLHIFLSAGYLTSLAVTVLIIYVMNLPVNHGIQGAYVVAIVLTGLILGGAALLIPDMTEGLGCLFGGFCVAMWLLVLTPGGLLTTIPQVVVFIVCFTFAGWATSFSRLTRPYGLIGLMSFGGATVVVIGIDCFSRAGLKEFWAYIWNLNQNLFPLGATTYPLTKGMKVEIAAIIIIFFIGMISQSKVWNFVKKRRERRALERQSDRRDLGREEEKVGRRIETATARQREYWESIYGTKDNTGTLGSGIDSLTTTKAGPTSTVTSLDRPRQEPVEMDELSIVPANTGPGGGRENVRPKSTVGANDGYPQPRSSMSFMATRTNRVSQTSRRDSKMAAARKSTIPDFVPLPFVAPLSEDDDESSVATVGDDDNANRLSKRFSQGSELLRSLSQRSNLKPNRLSKAPSNSAEQLVEPHVVEDDRSSVAATVDNMTENEESIQGIPEGTPKQSPTRSDFEEKSSKDLVERDTNKTPLHSEANPTSSKGGGPGSTETAALPESIGPMDGASTVRLEKGIPDAATEMIPPAPEPQQIPLTKESLPPPMPRVASSFRTNEWAKHISNADVPEVDDLKLIQNTSTTEAESDEAPIRVLIKDIQKREEESQAMLVSMCPSQITSFPSPPQPARIKSYQSLQSASLESTATSTDLVSHPHSQQSHKKQLEPQVQPIRTSRNSSAPSFVRTIVESAAEEQALPSTGSLLDKRESTIRNKSSTTSLTPTPDASARPASLIPSSKNYNARIEGDKFWLPNRPSVTRLSSSSAIQQINTFDSHQPRRQSSTPVDGPSRDMQLAQWRASVRQGIEANVKPEKSLERSTSAMLQQRLISDRQKEMEQTRKGMRDSMMEERMRKGDMLEAHKEAMKKMQKEANKHLS